MSLTLHHQLNLFFDPVYLDDNDDSGHISMKKAEHNELICSAELSVSWITAFFLINSLNS